MACPEIHGLGVWPEGSEDRGETVLCGSCKRVYSKIVPVVELTPEGAPKVLGVMAGERPRLRDTFN